MAWSSHRWLSGLVAVLTLLAVPVGAEGSAAAAGGAPISLQRVIVMEADGAGDAPEQAVAAAGGAVTQQLDLIGGFAATLPADAADAIAARGDVISVTDDEGLEAADYDGVVMKDGPGTMWLVNDALEIKDVHDDQITGRGIDVAVIDSGVAPVPALGGDRLIHGPDLSVESQLPELAHYDAYGHGTHLAGIVAGAAVEEEDDDDKPVEWDDLENEDRENGFIGVAPESRIVSLKVADQMGAADVSQVIAAIDWVVANRQANGLNIRVMLLAYGTQSGQDALSDPLSHAVEQAWRHGIVVVVSGGNGGNGATNLTMPARNPHVIAVGATDMLGEDNLDDHVVSDFSQGSAESRGVDVVAPGTNIISLRSPGSYLDTLHPHARRGEDELFRGSGTSQAAAVVAGVAALMLSAYPDLTPDDVKMLMLATAEPLDDIPSSLQGAGALNAKDAVKEADDYVDDTYEKIRDLDEEHADDDDYEEKRTKLVEKMYRQNHPRSNGRGSLDAARGGIRISDEHDVLDGEYDIFGREWDPDDWAQASESGASWSDGSWNGNRWSGSGWNGNRWSGAQWTGNRWSGAQWTGAQWTGAQWTGNRWSGARWTGAQWTGSQWTSYGWTGDGWAGGLWSTAFWG